MLFNILFCLSYSAKLNLEGLIRFRIDLSEDKGTLHIDLCISPGYMEYLFATFCDASSS